MRWFVAERVVCSTNDNRWSLAICGQGYDSRKKAKELANYFRLSGRESKVFKAIDISAAENYIVSLNK